jgi:hypothetical protein
MDSNLSSYQRPEEAKHMQADLESMANELERIRDYVFNKKEETTTLPQPSKVRKQKTNKLLVVADEIYSDSGKENGSSFEEEYSGDMEGVESPSRPKIRPSSLLED